MGSLLHDLRFAVRLLRKSPVFTGVTVLTLALAVAANTVIFTGVNAVLLRPLPYAEPDQLVRLYTQFPQQQLDRFSFSAPEYADVARETRTLSAVGGWFIGTANFTGGDQPLSARQAFLTASLLPTLGVQPQLGRSFTPDEDRPNGPKLVLIGHTLWQQSFHGGADVLGRTVQVNGVTTTIVGVMPRGFEFPAADVQLWSPAQLDPTDSNRANHALGAVGRLKPGASVDAANADLRDLAAAWSAAHPKKHYPDPANHPIIARSLKGEVVDSARGLLWMMQGVVFFVLLIACANVSNLLVARADVRRGEIAVRMAMGAGRLRLARQFLVESLVLGGCGAAVGMLITPWALDAMMHLLPADTPRASEIRIDGVVLAFAVASALLASLIFGLAPILHTGTAGLRASLVGAAHRATGSGRSALLRRGLVVVEIALATVLVTGAGLFARSFAALQKVDLGFDPGGVVTFRILVNRASVADDPSLVRFYQDLSERLHELPGVDSVAAMSAPPPHRQMNNNDVWFPGRTMDPKGPVWNVDYWQMTVGDHVKTLGGRIVAGRALEPSDDAHGQLVVLVNEAFARRFWPGEDPIGKHLRAIDGEDPDLTVVGVVGDMKYAGLDQPTGTELVLPAAQVDADSPRYSEDSTVPRVMTFVLRTHADPRAVFGGVRAVMSRVAPSIPVADLRIMEDAVHDDVARPRFLTALVLGFAAIALVMALVGVYGVMSYAVVQRSQEIGIRIALGAPAGRVVRMLLREGLALAAAGVAFGLGLAFVMQRALSHVLSELLFGAERVDVLLLLGVVAALGAVALVACWVPARRASRIHPTLAMRVEA